MEAHFEPRGALPDADLRSASRIDADDVASLLTELGRFPNAELVWCQEEPKNMGGWTFVDPWLELTLDKLSVKSKRARYVGRPASASTAAGLMSRHLRELDAFLTDAFA